MNERIYIDRKNAAPISLVEETLSDGSKVYNLELLTASIPLRDEKKARETMQMIAVALRHSMATDILHL